MIVHIIFEVGVVMFNFIASSLGVLCIVIIIAVVMQPLKNNATSSLSGGSEELFARRKARGFEAFMQRVTMVLLILFFILTIALMYATAKGL